MTLQMLLSHYANYRDIRPSTIRQYELSVRSLTKFLGREATTEDLTSDTVNRWLRSLDLSPFTIRCHRRQLLAIWRGGADLDLLAGPPKGIRRIATPERVIRTLTSDECQKLVTVASRARGKIAGLPAAWYLETFIRATLDTAMRKSDLHGLDRQRVITARGRLEIVQVKSKRRRVVRLSGATLTAVKALASDGPKIWPEPRRELLTRWIRRLAIQAGIGHVTHTDLRRSAIYAVEKQAPGTGWLFAGHSCDQITRQWYLPAGVEYDRLPKPDLLPPDGDY